MLAAALEAEVAAYIAAHAHEVDEHGHRLVVRNGYHGQRQVLTAAGAVPVRAPRVNDKRVDQVTGERSGSPRRSCRRGPQVPEGRRGAAAAVPARLVQRGLRARRWSSSWHRRRPVAGDDHPADQAVAGRARRFGERICPAVDYVYLWADGIHLNVRLDEDEAVPAGDDRGPRRRHQGAGRAGRRLPRVDRVVGRPAARLPNAAACAPRCSPSATARSGSGRRCARCSRRPGSNAAGSTRSRNVLAALPKSAQPGATKAARGDLERRGPRPRRARPSRRSRWPTAPSCPRPSRRSPTTSTSCSRSTTSRPSTGSTCAPRTRSSRGDHRARPCGR